MEDHVDRWFLVPLGAENDFGIIMILKEGLVTGVLVALIAAPQFVEGRRATVGVQQFLDENLPRHSGKILLAARRIRHCCLFNFPFSSGRHIRKADKTTGHDQHRKSNRHNHCIPLCVDGRLPERYRFEWR
jgi:hypothetical protein